MIPLEQYPQMLRITSGVYEEAVGIMAIGW